MLSAQLYVYLTPVWYTSFINSFDVFERALIRGKVDPHRISYLTGTE